MNASVPFRVLAFSLRKNISERNIRFFKGGKVDKMERKSDGKYRRNRRKCLWVHPITLHSRGCCS